MPEKSGVGAAPCAAGLSGRAASCPQVGLAAIAANIVSKRKCGCIIMLPSRPWLPALMRGVGNVIMLSQKREWRTFEDDGGRWMSERQKRCCGSSCAGQGANRKAFQAEATDFAKDLIVATHSGTAAVVQALLDKGAEVNAKVEDGATAL